MSSSTPNTTASATFQCYEEFNEVGLNLCCNIYLDWIWVVIYFGTYFAEVELNLGYNLYVIEVGLNLDCNLYFGFILMCWKLVGSSNLGYVSNINTFWAGL